MLRSTLDRLKVAQFVLREAWFENNDRTGARKYPWGEKSCKPGNEVPAEYIGAYAKENEKARTEFESFLQ